MSPPKKKEGSSPWWLSSTYLSSKLPPISTASNKQRAIFAYFFVGQIRAYLRLNKGGKVPVCFVLAHQAVWHPKGNKTHTPATNPGFVGAVQPVLSGLRMQRSSNRSRETFEARELMRNKFVVDV